MLGYDRIRRLDGLRKIWEEEMRILEPGLEAQEAGMCVWDVLEAAYRRTGTMFRRGEWLRRATGYRRTQTHSAE